MSRRNYPLDHRFPEPYYKLPHSASSTTNAPAKKEEKGKEKKDQGGSGGGKDWTKEIQALQNAVKKIQQALRDNPFGDPEAGSGQPGLIFSHAAHGGLIQYSGNETTIFDPATGDGDALFASLTEGLGWIGSDQKIQWDATDTVKVAGWSLSPTRFSATIGTAFIDASTPAIGLGGATDYMAGIGIFLGWSGAAYKAHIGNPAGDHLSFDGVNLQVTGYVTASGSNIAATDSDTFTINADQSAATAGIIIQRPAGVSASILWNGSVLDIDKPVQLDSNLTARHILPATVDTYDLGSATLLWRKGYLSEMDAVLFAKQTISLLGGWFMVTKNEGELAAAVAPADTSMDFGQAMTTGHFVVMRAAGSVEYVQVGALVSGTRYAVTRNLDGSGADTWAQGTPYAVLGTTGDGRIELNSYDTPRISILSQGATYNAQTELIRLGDLNGLADYATQKFGIFIGDYAGNKWLAYDPTNSLRIRGDALIDGTVIAGKLAANSVVASNILAGAITADKLSVGIGGGNLCADGSFELGSDAFATRTAGITQSYVATDDAGAASPFSATMNRFGWVADGNQGIWMDQVITVLAGQKVTVSFWQKAAKTTTLTGIITAYWSDTTTTNVSYPINTAQVWTKQVATFTVPAGVTTMRLIFNFGTAGYWWYVLDQLQVEYGDVATAWKPNMLSSGIVIDGRAISIGNPPPTGPNAGTGLWEDSTGVYVLDANTVVARLDRQAVVKTSADFTTISSYPTLVGVTDFSVNIAANETWAIDAYFRAGNTGSNGFCIGLLAPAGATGSVYMWGPRNIVNYEAVWSWTGLNATSLSFLYGIGGAGSCELHALVNNGANAGALQVAACRDAAAGTVTVYSRGYIVARRVG